MSRAVRRTRWGALAAAAVAGLSACALALGVQDDPRVAVHYLCDCPEINATIEPNNCESTLGARLSLVMPEERSAWLQKYVDRCTNCANTPTCFYTPPTCVGPSNACSGAAECCSYQHTSDPNACDSGICQ